MIINAAIDPELKGKLKLFTNNNSIILKNFNVFGRINLKIPIRINSPKIFANKNPYKEFIFKLL
jgi:hypothetical protein